jgi:hypothetical protein
MKPTFFHGWRRLLVVPILVVPLLFTNLSCVTADEAELIESLLDNLDSMGGEMTFVTNDGKTITITVSQESTAGGAGENEEVKNEEEECEEEEKCQEDYGDLSGYLPKLDSIEDVFRTLGVWEQADVLYGLTGNWTHVAAELDYDHENMYAALETIITNQLHEAEELGLINQEQYEYKVGLYSEKALKWVNKIFADTGEGTPELADYLPILNSVEDVFKTLGVWEVAEAWREEGLTWAHIAEELGYNMESLNAALQAVIQNQLHEAKSLGLISYEQYQAKVNHYGEKAGILVNEIF